MGIPFVSNRPLGLDKDTLLVRGQIIAVGYDDNFNTWVSVSHDLPETIQCI
ncbi:MAG TPA: hypothetical protein VKR42_07410 [Ktedonobacteraceae bacterium]|nr:hypothetical protein [Ktedonobacteraceae bacterium]